MKAIIIENPGGAEVLQQAELPTPQISDNEVLVQVKAFSINPVDIKTRSGKAFYQKLAEQPPIILGWDISGVVTRAGAAVTQFKEGDEVFGMVNFPGHGRAYAEFVAAPADHLALKPRNISHLEAAAATLAALTAWQVLVHKAQLQAGQRVLVHAAAGGVGHFAVQIAKHLGAHITGTSSSANRDFVLSLGAHEHIDYNARPVEEQVQDLDLAFDCVGGDYVARSLQVVKRGGAVAGIAGGFTDEVKQQAEQHGIKAIPHLVNSSAADMEQIAQLLQSGALKPHLSHTFSFGQIQQAHLQIETGRTRGKVVVEI